MAYLEIAVQLVRSSSWLVMHVDADRRRDMQGTVDDLEGAIAMAMEAGCNLKVSAVTRAQMTAAGAAPREWPRLRYHRLVEHRHP
ncbi:MAG: hypothetical protein JWN20_1573 [Jatrophihabitantaceae bacterium]|nr:hypothetical protein [Jatrophihabitantaceae bacterium]